MPTVLFTPGQPDDDRIRARDAKIAELEQQLSAYARSETAADNASINHIPNPVGFAANFILTYHSALRPVPACEQCDHCGVYPSPAVEAAVDSAADLLNEFFDMHASALGKTRRVCEAQQKRKPRGPSNV